MYLQASLILCYLLFTACSHLGATKTSALSVQDLEELNQIPIYDAHTHIDFDSELQEDTGFRYTKEELEAQMKEAHAVALVSHSSRSGALLPHNNIPAVRCLAVTDKMSVREANQLLASKEYRCLKIYLGYVYRWAKDPFYKQFYRLARKYKVPVVFHTGDTYDVNGHLKYADPLTIDEVAVEFRDVNFVIAHLGNPWIASAAEVVYKNPNVYVEASAMMIGDFKNYTEEELQEYVIQPIAWAFGYIENPKKFMFGTDWPLVRIKDYRDVYARAIPKKYWRAVFYDNAVRLFGLP